MDKAVAGTEEIHEGAEIHHLHHLSSVNHAYLGLGGDGLDHVDSLVDGGGVHGGYLDGAVVVDIHLGTGNLTDFPDHLAAGSNHFTDFFLGDGQSDDTRCVVADVISSGNQCIVHLAEDMESAPIGLG